jgi:hypothetical protein
MIRRLAIIYLQSWLLLLWSVLCVGIGATWAFIAIIGTLKAKGIL